MLADAVIYMIVSPFLFMMLVFIVFVLINMTQYSYKASAKDHLARSAILTRLWSNKHDDSISYIIYILTYSNYRFHKFIARALIMYCHAMTNTDTCATLYHILSRNGVSVDVK